MNNELAFESKFVIANIASKFFDLVQFISLFIRGFAVVRRGTTHNDNLIMNLLVFVYHSCSDS